MMDTEEGDTSEYPTQRIVEKIIDGTIVLVKTIPK